MDEIVKMSVKEFRSLGLLQELNRLFLHPRGLALEVVVDDETGDERFGSVWDYRNDPEGMAYAEGMMDTPEAVAKAEYVSGLFERIYLTRMVMLGYTFQPVGGRSETTTRE
jgi:hypothetical protein